MKQRMLHMARRTPRKLAWLTQIALLVSVGGAGAATPMGPMEEVRKIVAERTGASVSTSVDAPQRIEELLTGELGVDEAVQLALLKNRSVQASLRELGIAAADLRQAKLVKNPEVEFELRFPDRPFELSLTQDVVDVFLRPLRKRAASSVLRATQLRVALTILDHAAEVRRAFYSLQAESHARDMGATIADASGASAVLAERQHAAGNISNLMLDNSLALDDDAKLDLAEREIAVVEARERLNRLMGASGRQTSWRIAAHVPNLPDRDLDLEGLETLASNRRLDLAAGAEDIAAARQFIPLARAGQWPGFALGVHLEREPEGERTIGPAFYVSLPIFDRGQAAAAAARARYEQSHENQAALSVDVGSEVRAAFASLRAARERVEYLRDVVLPRRERIVAETQREYNFMLVGVYHLIEAKQNEIEARRTHIFAQRDYWLAHTELERVVGGSLYREPIVSSERTGG